MRARLLATACIAAFLIASVSSTAARTAQATARKFYISVVDKQGAPVKDMTAAELEVKEGGKAVEAAALKPAAAPLRVALLISDGGIGAYQGAAGFFIGQLKGAEFKLYDVAQQAVMVADYASDMSALSAGVQKLSRRAANRMQGQVLEAILDATKTVGAEGKRPVIVVMRIGNEATTSLQSSTVREALRKAGAKLFVISPPGGGGLGASGMGVAQSSTKADEQRANQESMDNAAQLNQVLNDGAKESGGRHDQVASPGLQKILEQLAAELQNQYELTYSLPAGAKPSDKLQVSTKRKDVKIFAPSKIPN